VPYKVVTRLSDLNYEIVDEQNKKLTVHVNRLKPNYNPQTWKPKLKQKGTKKLPKKPTSYQEADKQEDEHYLGRFPLRKEVQLHNRTSPDQTSNTPEPDPQSADISISENTDPNYEPPQTPTLRRELQHTHTGPPVRRSRARIMSQELWFNTH
jgi:hypothetical protein